MSFFRRLNDLFDMLEADESIRVIKKKMGEPLSENELKDVQYRLGYTLDDRFLYYFRSCNGVNLRWEKVGLKTIDGELKEKDFRWVRGFSIPSLVRLFFADMGYTFGEGYDEPFWGGLTDDTLRRVLRVVDAFHPAPLETNSYPTVGLIADKCCPNPVVTFCEDHCACVSLPPCLQPVTLRC